MAPPHGCICNWDKCNTYFNFFKDQAEHPWHSKKLVQIDYNLDNVDSRNFWKGVCSFLKPSQSRKKELQDKFEENKRKGAATPTGKVSQVTYKIAKHHFSPAICMLGAPLNAPLPIEVARNNNCFPNRNAFSDALLRFDTAGKSEWWLG